MTETVIRVATPEDLGAIAAIYAHHVQNGLGTFEEDPPSVAEMGRRFHDVVGRGLPFLVAEDDGRVVGYAYAAPYRLRSAYRYTVEDSVYIAAGRARAGIGRKLLTHLIERCTALGYRQMIAVIGDSGNQGSIGLHSAMGFRPAGSLRAAGFKFGRWVDSVLMQKPLGHGDTSIPDR